MRVSELIHTRRTVRQFTDESPSIPLRGSNPHDLECWQAGAQLQRYQTQQKPG